MADLFDIVVARKLSGGGGGGSSDFSTAEVTVVNNTTNETIYTFFSYAFDGQRSSNSSAYFPLDVETHSFTESMILYKGAGIAYISAEMPTITGAAQMVGQQQLFPDTDNFAMILITGDCTITIGGNESVG